MVVRAVRDGAEVLITVTDTGIGVPEADRERIFESFQQGGRGSSREEGTGLGLTLSRRIVELLGGRMWLESEVGRGSTFGFSLPARRAAPADAADGGGEPQARRRGRRHRGRPAVAGPVQRLPVRRGAEGHAPRATVSPASLRCDGRRPDAVLLDIRLPGIDGWAVLKALKAEPETRDIPVIVVSIVDERARGAAMGAAAYLVKPIGREELLSALAAVGAPVQTLGTGARRSSETA